MKLKNDLYKILCEDKQGFSGRYEIKLNGEHFIYQAHFPGEPITPGVCIVQIGQELLEELIGRNLRIQTVKNVKFLQVITPTDSHEVSYHLNKIQLMDDGAVKAQILVTREDKEMAKLSLVCR